MKKKNHNENFDNQRKAKEHIIHTCVFQIHGYALNRLRSAAMTDVTRSAFICCAIFFFAKIFDQPILKTVKNYFLGQTNKFFMRNRQCYSI
jgi:hypothetical protein